MAEFGDPLLQLLDDPNIDRVRVIDAMMDFSYVQASNNRCELKAILRTLRSASNKGQFMLLEQAVENRIMELLPEKERRRIRSISMMEPTFTEALDAKKSLDTWLESIMTENFSSVNTNSKDSKVRSLPPTRTHCSLKGKEIRSSSSRCDSSNRLYGQSTHPTPQRISKETISNRDYFSAWDKFDVDAAEQAIDDTENEIMERTKASLYGTVEEKIHRARARHQSELLTLQKQLQMNTLTKAERLALAQRERLKGNEFYRCGENEEAIACYTKSIAFDETNAIVYSNRAMAAMRLSHTEQALVDTTTALELDPFCVKARARRGTIHHRCGRYAQAIQDFQRCLEQDPENLCYARLLKGSVEKKKESQGHLKHEQTKKKLLIKESHDGHFDATENTRPSYKVDFSKIEHLNMRKVTEVHGN
jgi:tetratricopeptide (TPR) repeat protein